MNTKPYFIVWTALLAMLMMSGCALQRDVYMLEERLLTLEKRNRDLNKQIEVLDRERQGLASNLENLGKRKASGDQELRGQYAGINANIDTLREEISALSGRLEETEFYIQKQQSATGSLEEAFRQKQNLMAEDLAKTRQRLDVVEQYLNMEKGGAKPQAAAAAAPAAKPDNAADIYAAAKKAFDAGKLDQARNGFDTVVKKFPKSGQADNAQFWLGEIYYREKWYEKAILEYQKVIENYPKGNKLPAALLKQGLAFLKIGDKANAKLILQELLDKHPQTNEGRIAAQKIKEL
ncbi:MAG: tol-pal system protein YbgF [Desulfosarcinaceae bacterium]|nr:tol-pal system protein YbgF [Desulfosarcinaceae bacterium]